MVARRPRRRPSAGDALLAPMKKRCVELFLVVMRKLGCGQRLGSTASGRSLRSASLRVARCPISRLAGACEPTPDWWRTRGATPNPERGQPFGSGRLRDEQPTDSGWRGRSAHGDVRRESRDEPAHSAPAWHEGNQPRRPASYLSCLRDRHDLTVACHCRLGLTWTPNFQCSNLLAAQWPGLTKCKITEQAPRTRCSSRRVSAKPWKWRSNRLYP